MYLCMYVCIYIYVYVYVYVHIYIYMDAYTSGHTYADADTGAYADSESTCQRCGWPHGVRYCSVDWFRHQVSIEDIFLKISNRSANPCMNPHTTRRASATHSYHCCLPRRDRAASQRAGPAAVAAGRGEAAGRGVRGVENRFPGDTNL